MRAKPRTWARSVIAVELTDKNRVSKTESMMAFARETLRRFGLAVVIRGITLVDKGILYCEIVW